MSSAIPRELHLLLDSAGALIVFQEKGATWAGVLAFSSEDKAREFCRASNLDAAEVAALSTDDPQAVAGLIALDQAARRFATSCSISTTRPAHARKSISRATLSGR